MLQVDESIEVDASPERVWRAIADAEVLAAWWDGMTLDARTGGRFDERWTDETGTPCRTSGRVESCTPHEELVLSWADDDWPATTWVEITIAPIGRLRSQVRVRQLGFEHFDDGATLTARHRDGWRHHLENWARAATQSVTVTGERDR